MEANKERREQVEMKKEEKQEEKKNEVLESKNHTAGFDPMAKLLIRKSIVPDGGDRGAEAPEDVLAFSRSVHKIDSSLEWNYIRYRHWLFCSSCPHDRWP